MFNPFSYLWVTVKGLAYYAVHPKELAKATVDPKIGAIYHVSSVNTAVGLGSLSVAKPTWARDLTTAAGNALVEAKTWLATEGPLYVKAAAEMAKEFGVS